MGKITKPQKTKPLNERLETKLRKVINSRVIVNKIKTRSVTKRQLNEKFIEANIDTIRENLGITHQSSRTQTLDNPGPSGRPRSRPLLSSTRGDDLDIVIYEALSDSEDLNLTAIELVVNSSQGELLVTTVSTLDAIEESLLSIPDPVVPSSPDLHGIVQLPPNLADQEAEAVLNQQLALTPRKIRREVWEVVRNLSTSGSPTKIAAALHVIADEASNNSVEPPPTPTTSESLRNSVSLPSTPISPTMSAADAATAAEATACGDIYVEATLAWEEIVEIDLTKLPMTAIEQHATESDNHKKQLTAAYMRARKLPADKLVEFEDSQMLLTLKGKFLEFRDKAWKLMGEAQSGVLAAGLLPIPGAAAATLANSRTNSRGTNISTPEDILTDRVAARKQAVISTADEISERLARLANRQPSSTPEFTDLEAKVDVAATEAKDSLAELKELASAATKVGDADSARDLTEAADRLANSKTRAVTCVRQVKHELGIPASGFNRNMQHNIKPPVFKGDFREALDFYTFERQLTEYLDATGYRVYSEKLTKLRHDCLVGPAKEAINNCKTFQEAMQNLRTHYAKPLVLLAMKTKEIKDYGPCPEPVIPRQQWFIKIANKLKFVMDLCDEHEETDFLISSDITCHIIAAMRKDDRDDYDKKLVAASQRCHNGRFSRVVMAQRLATYFVDTIDKLNHTLDYKITSTFGNTDELIKSLQLDAKAPKAPQPFVNNRRGAHVAAPGYEDGAISQLSHISGTSSGYGSGVAPEASIEAAKQPKASKRQRKKDRGATPEAELAAQEAVAKVNVVKAADTSPWQQQPVNKSKDPKSVYCKLCKGQHEYLTYCTKFREAQVKERWGLVLSTSTCYRCLRSDSGFIIKDRENWFREHKPFCNDKFACKTGLCAKNEDIKQNHILICRYHEEHNRENHSGYLATLDKNRLRDHPKLFYTPTGGVYTSKIQAPGLQTVQPVYMLQYVVGKDGKLLLVFYDSGCMGAVISDRAYSLLDTVPGTPGPIPLEVAGGQTINNPYGYENFALKQVKGEEVQISALRMVEATSELPLWELRQAWQDVASNYEKSGGTKSDLPTCPERIGGTRVDIMLGIEYFSCFPELIYELPSGLRLYKSRLQTPDGHLGVLGGPHEAWTRAAAAANIIGPRVYFTAEVKAMKSMYKSLKSTLKWDMPCMPDNSVNIEAPVKVQCVDCHCWEDMLVEGEECGENLASYSCYQSISSELKRFQAAEDIGGSIEYRCVVCRNCHACKNSDQVETLSLQEEKEQAQIEACVRLDNSSNTLFAKLPFIKDPEEKLKPNKRIAHKILDTQVRIIEKTPGMRESVQKAHNKLLDKGHVVKLTDLPQDLQDKIMAGPYYFIPWRTVINLGSLSTPRRVVYDASSRTPGGESLNDILARGMNKLGKLLHLLVKFRYGSSAFSADIQMAYNSIKLDPDFYQYQQYLWKENLTSEEIAVVMIVVTVIYGVKPSGNLTIAGFQKVVEAAKELGGNYLIGALCLEVCAYMDDIFSAHPSKAERDSAAASLQEVLKLGSMSIKAITKSGEDPPEVVTSDEKTVGVVGYKWSTKEDKLSLDVKPITLEKTRRGQPGEPVEGDLAAALAAKFTKRVLAGRVASVFDPLGICTPITAQLKVDMSFVCKMATGWDSSLPPELIPVWVNNLEQVRQLDQISVPRNVGVQKDGEYGFEMIVCVDASETIACAAVYARTEPEPGIYDCNLILAKSKLATKCTIPKGEMRAATLGANLAHIVRSNIGQYITKEYFITDSTISLCWLHQDQRPLQISVRNSVLEVRRFSNLEDWYHTPSEENPADIGTRPVTVDEIKGESDWFKGRPWMRGPPGDMPLRQVKDLKLSKEEESVVASEVRATSAKGMVLTCKVSKVGERLKFSNYLIDPISQSWPKFLRSMSIIFRVVQVWRRKLKRYKGEFAVRLLKKIGARVVINIEFEDLEAAKKYIFLRTTKELKYFNNRDVYSRLGQDVDGVFLYTGRVLDGDTPLSITGAMLDLKPLSFCVPVLDRYSPVAYTIMLHYHEQINHHGGIKSTYRRSLELCHILKGLALAEEVRLACVNCRRYKVRLLEAEMGKIHQARFTPAPAFYFVQADLAGPWDARCENHPRINPKIGPIKIWAAVFKCCTSLAISVEVMTDYTASSFIDAYIRFSSRYGHTGVMYIDPGTNLMSACEKMEISYTDLSKGINARGVEMNHEVCVTGSHESQGLVERSIREIRKIYNAVFRGFKMSVIGYQTAFYYIANELNNIPLCLGGNYKNLDHLDLITPNRLLLGRNNERAPVGLVQATVPSIWMDKMSDIGKAWWKVWESEWLVNLIPKSTKWSNGEPDIEIGDVVVFMREGKEADLGQTPWRTGLVDELHSSRDGTPRSATLKYKNHNEEVFRYTKRSVRTAAVIHREAKLDLLGELNLASIDANKHFICNYHFVS